MKTLIMLSAIPASGKTTWAKEYQKNHEHCYIVNSDDVRMEVTNGNYQDHTRQKEVWELFEKRIHEYALKGDDIYVILDALCDLNSLRKKYVVENPEYDRYVLVLFPHDLEELKKYNKLRDARSVVPDEALIALYKKFEEPTEEILELYDEIRQVEF